MNDFSLSIFFIVNDFSLSIFLIVPLPSLSIFSAIDTDDNDTSEKICVAVGALLYNELNEWAETTILNNFNGALGFKYNEKVAHVYVDEAVVKKAKLRLESERFLVTSWLFPELAKYLTYQQPIDWFIEPDKSLLKFNKSRFEVQIERSGAGASGDVPRATTGGSMEMHD